MLQHPTSPTKTFLILVAVIMATAQCGEPVFAAEPARAPAPVTLDLPLDGQLSGSLEELESGQRWRLRVPSTGVVTLHLAVSAELEGALELALADGDGESLGLATVLERTSMHLALAAHSAGNLVFELRLPENPSFRPWSLVDPAFRISTRFIPARVAEQIWESDQTTGLLILNHFYSSDPFDKADPVEYDPDPGFAGTLQKPRLAVGFDKADPVEYDPDPGLAEPGSHLLATVATFVAPSPQGQPGLPMPVLERALFYRGLPD